MAVVLDFGSKPEPRVPTHLLEIPPPGGSPGIFSEVRYFITYSKSGSSSFDLSIFKASANKQSKVLKKTRKKPRKFTHLYAFKSS